MEDLAHEFTRALVEDNESLCLPWIYRPLENYLLQVTLVSTIRPLRLDEHIATSR